MQGEANFLLWQIAYAELYVTDTLWPDFNHFYPELLKAVLDFQKRERRFGGLPAAPQIEPEVTGPNDIDIENDMEMEEIAVSSQ